MSNRIDAQNLNLDDIRRRAYRAVTQDGLLELLFGVGFATAAIFAALDVILDIPLFFLIGIPAIVLPMLLAPLRQRFTHPRIGYVELVSEESKRLMNAMMTVSAILGAVVLAVTFFALAFEQVVSPVVVLFENLALILGQLFGLGFLYMALRYGITRFYIYGVVSIVGSLIVQAIDTSWLSPAGDPVARWTLYFALMAAFLLVGGALMFMRFLRENPVLDAEDYSE